MNWHDIVDPQDAALDALAAQYHLHPLHVEDCRHRNQRTKLEENENYIFGVLKTVQIRDGEVELQDVDVFLGADWVITVEEGNRSEIRSIFDPIRAMQSNLRADQVFYRVFDGIVDSYLPTIDHIDDVIDEVEEQVLQQPDPEVLSRIFRTKRILIDLRRVLVNTRDVSAHLYRTEHSVIHQDLLPFLRDIYDHVARNLDLVETQRDLLTGTMDVYLSSVANRTNETMKVLTILGTIALPVLVVSGFYGMNTKGLPFVDSPHGTVIVSALMLASTVILLILLKKFRWF